MNFSLSKWRRTYDLVHGLGRKLRDSRPTMDEKNNKVEAINPLGEEEEARLEKKIQMYLDNIRIYMDDTRMKFRPGLWVYHRDDPTTWASHDTFKYGHLLKNRASKIKGYGYVTRRDKN